jgi:thiol-disulfide isomerase/thioredoxin
MAKRARRTGKRNGRRAPPPPPPTFLEQNWRILASLVVVVLIIAGGVWAVTSYDPEGEGDDKTPQTNMAPDFSLTTIDGEPVQLDQFRGRVVVLDLMATWCNPCVLQMEHLNQLRNHYPPGQLEILSIGVDLKESAEQLRTFKNDNFATWRFARDTDGLGQKYDASSIPTLVIIDQEGRQQWRHAGVTTYEDLVDRIDPLIR